MITVDKIKSIMDGDVNPFKKGFAKAPFSANYRKILEGRKKLPVFDKMQEFFDVVSFFGRFYPLSSQPSHIYPNLSFYISSSLSSPP